MRLCGGARSRQAVLPGRRRAGSRGLLSNPENNSSCLNASTRVHSGTARTARSWRAWPAVRVAATDAADGAVGAQPSFNWEDDGDDINSPGPAFVDTLSMLEWPRLCSHLAAFASTAVGKRRCLALPVPLDEATSVRLLEETR
jgi:hypothetical protein